MSQNNEIKILKAQAKLRRQELEYSVLKTAIASPIVQVMGTVAAAELLEKAGVLSGRWAGAIEGGVITAIFLQALKEYGIVGAGTLGLGVGIGAGSDSTSVDISGTGEKALDFAKWGLLGQLLGYG